MTAQIIMPDAVQRRRKIRQRWGFYAIAALAALVCLTALFPNGLRHTIPMHRSLPRFRRLPGSTGQGQTVTGETSFRAFWWDCAPAFLPL